MASINGIELKALKGFEGHEGYCFQGNVYKDGKKLGFWSQDSWGGPDEFRFDESLLDKACSDFADGFPDDYEHKAVCGDIEVFMGAVLDLKLCEQDMKPVFKGGAKSIYFMTDGFHRSWMGFRGNVTVEGVRKNCPDLVRKMEDEMFKSGFKEFVFTQDGFDIVIDKDHPAPEILR